MNRKKKIFDIFNTKVKKAKARMNPGSKGNKPKYVSKAQREKLAAEAEAVQALDENNTTDAQPESH
jgi:hypothetical protein